MTASCGGTLYGPCSTWSELGRQRLDRPSGTAAAEEVVVARQDRSIKSKSKGKGNWRPVVRSLGTRRRAECSMCS